MGPYRTLRDYTGPYRTIRDHEEPYSPIILYGIIWSHMGPGRTKRTIQYHTGVYGTIWDRTGPYRTIRGRTGYKGIIRDYRGPYRTIWTYIFGLKKFRLKKSRPKMFDPK